MNNNSYQYSTINRGHDEEENLTRDAFSHEGFNNNNTSNSKKYSPYHILAGIVVMSAFVGTYMHTSSRSAAAAGGEVPLLGMAKSRSCTFKECFGNNCNQEAAPFICLRHNGGPHMGWYVSFFVSVVLFCFL